MDCVCRRRRSDAGAGAPLLLFLYCTLWLSFITPLPCSGAVPPAGPARAAAETSDAASVLLCTPFGEGTWKRKGALRGPGRLRSLFRASRGPAVLPLVEFPSPFLLEVVSGMGEDGPEFELRLPSPSALLPSPAALAEGVNLLPPSTRRLFESYWQAGRCGNALAVLQEYAARHGRSVWWYELAGWYYERSGMSMEAARCYSAALAEAVTQRDRDLLVYALVRLRLAAGDTRGASDLLRAHLRSIRARRGLVRRRPPAAARASRRLLRGYVERYRPVAVFLDLWALCEWLEGSRDTALEVLGRAAELFPGSPVLAWNRSVLYALAGRDETAVALLGGVVSDLRRVCAASARAGRRPEELGRLETRAHVLRAWCEWRRGRWKEALGLLDDVCGGAEAPPEAWYGRALVELRLGLDSRAALDARRAMAVAPDDGMRDRFRAVLDVVFEREMRRTLSRSVPGELLSSAPPRVDDSAVKRLASALRRAGKLLLAGDTAAAERVLSGVRYGNPGSADVWFYSGIVSMRRGRFEEAVRRFSRALQLDPSCWPAMSYRSFCLGLLGKLDEQVLEDARRAWTQAPRPETAANYGWLLLRSGGAVEAVEILWEALRRWPRSILLNYRLGLAYELCGLHELAAARFRKVAALGGDSPRLQVLLAVALMGAGDAEQASRTASLALPKLRDPRYAALARACIRGGGVWGIDSRTNARVRKAELEAASLACGGRLDEASRRLERLCAAYPHSAVLRIDMGVVRLLGGDVDGAYAAFAAALDELPDPRAVSGLVHCLLEKGELIRAADQFHLIAGAGGMLEPTPMTERMMERWRRVLDVNPRDVEARLALGMLCVLSCRPAEALSLLDGVPAGRKEVWRWRAEACLRRYVDGDGDEWWKRAVEAYRRYGWRWVSRLPLLKETLESYRRTERVSSASAAGVDAERGVFASLLGEVERRLVEEAAGLDLDEVDVTDTLVRHEERGFWKRVDAALMRRRMKRDEERRIAAASPSSPASAATSATTVSTLPAPLRGDGVRSGGGAAAVLQDEPGAPAHAPGETGSADAGKTAAAGVSSRAPTVCGLGCVDPAEMARKRRADRLMPVTLIPLPAPLPAKGGGNIAPGGGKGEVAAFIRKRTEQMAPRPQPRSSMVLYPAWLKEKRPELRRTRKLHAARIERELSDAAALVKRGLVEAARRRLERAFAAVPARELGTALLLCTLVLDDASLEQTARTVTRVATIHDAYLLRLLAWCAMELGKPSRARMLIEAAEGGRCSTDPVFKAMYEAWKRIMSSSMPDTGMYAVFGTLAWVAGDDAEAVRRIRAAGGRVRSSNPFDVLDALVRLRKPPRRPAGSGKDE